MDDIEFDEKVWALSQLEQVIAFRALGLGPRGKGVMINQAAGIIMFRRRCDRTAAFQFLIDRGVLEQRSVDEVARRIIDSITLVAPRRPSNPGPESMSGGIT